MNDYESFKQAYGQGTQAQKESRERRFGNNENYRNFKAQWEQEQNPQPQVSNPAPVQNQAQNQTQDNGSTYDNQGQNNQAYQNDSQHTQQSYDPNEVLDQSKFTNPNARVSVREGNARQTGQPDYQMESEARDNEIINNLNSYKVSNPEFFRDRETFNKSFNYGVRNARQQAVLDSFWVRKQDSDKISNYSTPESITEGMKNSELTSNQLNLLKEQYPDLYKQRQEREKELTNLRIVNKTVPTDPTDTADLLTQLTERLGLQAGTPYNITKRREDALEKYGVNKDSERLRNMQDEIYKNYELIASTTEQIQSESTGNASASLIAARINKATQYLQGRATALQQSYTAILQGRRQNIALAKDDMEALINQTNEDQRIFKNKLDGLGFAMNTAKFETPEQTRARDYARREKQESTKIDLKRKEKEMESELNSSLYDLSVADPRKLRSNLFNVIGDYYKKFGNIIQRSQSGVVDDIINYAKEHKVSIAEAMRKNFIEPLQGKSEYKKLMNKEYGISNEAPKDTITTYNGESVVVSYDQNGHLRINKPLTSQSPTSYEDSGMKGAGKRNNNPGNIKDQTFGSPIGVDTRGFAQFATPEDGFDALVEKIKFNQTSTKSRYYGKTIAQYFQLYAPSSDNNNPKAYAQTVASRLGVSVNTPISQVDSIKFAAAIAEHDSGYKYETYGKFRGGNAGGGSYSELRKGAYENYIRTRQDPTGVELKSMKIGLDQFYKEVASYQQATGYNPITDSQMSQVNQMSNTFQANEQVKAFEEAKSQGLSLIASIDRMSGPGDVSAVFQFMKTLDPRSVVREGEFDMAAGSMGKVAQWRNIFKKLESGQLLTPEQRQEFKEITKKMLIEKAKTYDTKYADLAKRLKLQGIPEEYLPTNMADEMRESLGIKNYNLNLTQEDSAQTPQDTPDYSKMQSIAPKSNGSNYGSLVDGFRQKQ